MKAILISEDEFKLRLHKVKTAMQQLSISKALICSISNIYYLLGRVISGYIYIDTLTDDVKIFVKRPTHLSDPDVCYIHKPENITEVLSASGDLSIGCLGLELGLIPFNTAVRLQKALGASELADAGAALSIARAVKTPAEIALIRESGIKHAEVYRAIPSLFHLGMSDMELQIEIEHLSRLEGCLGQFRISGTDMELFMGNVLVGDNADSPSPYDFAMGGAGINPSLPIGADGTVIRPGMAVMVDMNGNFTGHMTDMTRTFACGSLPQRAIDAHRLSIDICHELARIGTPGTPASLLYTTALEMAEAAGFKDEFMGHRQHAGFVGHGIGIEVNERPVLAPKSRDILQAGNVIAVEPKFVLPKVGAVGIENTYLVRDGGADMECLTLAPEELITLE